MSDLFLLSVDHMERISLYFLLSHKITFVDDRRAISRIVYAIKHGLQWKDMSVGYVAHKTLYNYFIHWSRLGVFNSIFSALEGEGPKPQRIMIDAPTLKRTATSLLRKRMFLAFRTR